MIYTNAEFRSILNGLGYRGQDVDEPNFPLSDDDSPLTDGNSIQAIEDFQIYFNLVVDGIAGPQTMAAAEAEMNVIHDELNQSVGTQIPLDQPFYGPITINAVETFESQNGFSVDGIASLPVRQQLYQLVNPEISSDQLMSIAV